MQFALSLFEPQIFEKSLILGECSEKNPAFLYHKKTGIIPCYHFSSSFPHGKNLSECRSALLRCKGRTHRSLLHKRTGRCAAQKPSSPAFHPFLSAPDRRLSEASRSLRNFSVESPTDYSLRHCFFRYFKFFRSVKKVSTGTRECQAPQPYSALPCRPAPYSRRQSCIVLQLQKSYSVCSLYPALSLCRTSDPLPESPFLSFHKIFFIPHKEGIDRPYLSPVV